MAHSGNHSDNSTLPPSTVGDSTQAPSTVDSFAMVTYDVDNVLSTVAAEVDETHGDGEEEAEGDEQVAGDEEEDEGDESEEEEDDDSADEDYQAEEEREVDEEDVVDVEEEQIVEDEPVAEAQEQEEEEQQQEVEQEEEVAEEPEEQPQVFFGLNLIFFVCMYVKIVEKILYVCKNCMKFVECEDSSPFFSFNFLLFLASVPLRIDNPDTSDSQFEGLSVGSMQSTT